MLKRTTLEIDDALLDRAKRALGCRTMRSTVEEALRRVAESAEGDRSWRAQGQAEYFDLLARRGDLDVLASDEMWR